MMCNAMYMYHFCYDCEGVPLLPLDTGIFGSYSATDYKVPKLTFFDCLYFDVC